MWGLIISLGALKAYIAFIINSVCFWGTVAFIYYLTHMLANLYYKLLFPYSCDQ